MTPIRAPMLLDGATGTNLSARGLPAGVCVEKWALENPEVIRGLQTEFLDAGSQILYAPTFSANRIKLAAHGLEGSVAEFNRALCALTREVAGSRALVAGDISPTGEFLEPFGELTFDELVSVYAEQIASLRDAGADLLVCETMLSLGECRAALLAAQGSGLPVMVTITVDGNGRTLSGCSALSALVTLQEMGAAAFGMNCSQGPEPMLPLLEQLIPYTKIPLIAKPNAGLPTADGSFDLSPSAMAEQLRPALKAGISLIGGCCGTTPEHIAAIRDMMDNTGFVQPVPAGEKYFAATERAVFPVDSLRSLSEPVQISDDLEDDLPDAQEDADAVVVTVRTSGDGDRLGTCSHMLTVPLVVLAESAGALERALRGYHGRALVDRRSAVQEPALSEIMARYGAVFYA